LHSVFTAYIFTVKYYVLFGRFKFDLGLDLKVLASTSAFLGLKHVASLNMCGFQSIPVCDRQMHIHATYSKVALQHSRA